MRSSYRQYEFNPSTRKEAIRQAAYGCEACQTVFGPRKIQILEAHHLLPIWFVVNYYPQLSIEIIKGIANLVVLCPNCHRQLHYQEELLDQQEKFLKIYDFFASKALISIEAYQKCQPKDLIFSLAKL